MMPTTLSQLPWLAAYLVQPPPDQPGQAYDWQYELALAAPEDQPES